jgi:hypothetical protein
MGLSFKARQRIFVSICLGENLIEVGTELLELKFPLVHFESAALIVLLRTQINHAPLSPREKAERESMIACLLENAALPKPGPFVKAVPSEPAGEPLEPAPAPPAAQVAQLARDQRNAGRREARLAKKMAESAVAATPCASVCM